MRTKFLSLMAVLFVSSLLKAEHLPERVIRIYELTIEGKKYLATVVMPKSSEEGYGTFSTADKIPLAIKQGGVTPKYKDAVQTKIDDKEESFRAADAILEMSQNWLIDLYTEMGMMSREALEKVFQSSESLKAGNSSLVLISEAENINNILAMSRIVTPENPNKLLPMEEQVKGTDAEGKVPRRKPRVRNQKEVLWADVTHDGSLPNLNSSLPLNFVEKKNNWWYQDVAEFKNFARDPNTHLLDALMTVAAAHGLHIRGAQHTPLSWTNEVKIITDKPAFQTGLAGSLGYQRSHIDQIVLECMNEKLRDFYASRGFKVIRSFPNPNAPDKTTYWMAAPSRTFFKKFLLPYSGKLGSSTIVDYSKNIWNLIKRKINPYRPQATKQNKEQSKMELKVLAASAIPNNNDIFLMAATSQRVTPPLGERKCYLSFTKLGKKILKTLVVEKVDRYH